MHYMADPVHFQQRRPLVSDSRSGRKLQQPERSLVLQSDRPHAGNQRACRIHRVQRCGGTRLLEAARRLRDLRANAAPEGVTDLELSQGGHLD